MACEGRPEADIPIEMRCVLTDGRIEVEVTDHGAGFDAADLEAHPAVTDPARLDYEGGLGIPLLRLLTDELEFRPTPAGTTVLMVFEPRIASHRTVADLAPGGPAGVG
jgi:anti-sigma regulatory factor (Ser/Thr protein kinase)